MLIILSIKLIMFRAQKKKIDFFTLHTYLVKLKAKLLFPTISNNCDVYG